MSTRILMAAAAAGALALVLQPGPALANKIVYSVSGQITATPVGHQITVAGKAYRIQPGSQADAQLTEVARGESVEVVLDGPPGSRSTRVVAIHDAPSR